VSVTIWVVLRRVALVCAAVMAGWLLLLVILGAAISSSQQSSTKERIAESLHANVTLGTFELALIRGHLLIESLSVRRTEPIGHLALDVGSVRCDLPPLGFAMFDRDCDPLHVREITLEVSTATLFKLEKRAKRAPVRADQVIIDDAKLVFLPSAFAPNLGRIEIGVDHAVAGPTVMRTPLSWLFSLRELRAHFALPAGITVLVAYKDGILTASGSLFGSGPIELPIQIPAAELAKDAHEEMVQLLMLGKQIAEKLVAKRAEDWLKAKLLK
jgi:hypothetical protein